MIDSTSQQTNSTVTAFRWALPLTHGVVFMYFLTTNHISILRRGVEPICWPYFETCGHIRFDESGLVLLLLVYGVLIIAAGCAIALASHRIWWTLTVALNVYLLALTSLDYRFRANEFYMLLWLNAVFLFWPAKRWAVPLIVISFYFWAGTLKLNYEWLSGAVLYNRLYIIPPSLTWLACCFVVLLEMVLIGGLLAKRAWLRWLTLGELALFHLQSLSQIHWFYPLLMAVMLSWFPIQWLVFRNAYYSGYSHSAN